RRHRPTSRPCGNARCSRGSLKTVPALVRSILRARRTLVKRGTGLGTGVRVGMAAPEKQALHFPPAFHGLEHGDFVGVFEVDAYRNSHGNAGHAQTLFLSLALQLL